MHVGLNLEDIVLAKQKKNRQKMIPYPIWMISPACVFSYCQDFLITLNVLCEMAAIRGTIKHYRNDLACSYFSKPSSIAIDNTFYSRHLVSQHNFLKTN